MLHKSVVVTFLLFLLLLASTAMVSAHTSDKVYTVDSFDISAQVLSTNTIRVKETEVLHFSGGTFSFMKRGLPTDNTDSINILSAGMDQQSMSEGSSTGQYEEDDSNPITVTWHFLAQPDTTHTFTLTYEIKGLVQKHPQQDLIDWQPLPLQHNYIRSATITINYPQNAALVQKPEVDQGTATVSTSPGRVIYQANNLATDQALELGLRFRPGLVSQEPNWQQNADMNAKLWPFLFVVGLLIAFLGSFFVVRRYRTYWRSSPSTAQLAELGVSTPPGDLPPALAGVLAMTKSGDPSWPQALATIFSLMDRGVITIAPPAQLGSLIGQTDFNLVLLNQPPDLRPHETALVEILFQKQFGGVKPRVSIQQAGERYRQRSSAFQEAVQSELAARGIMDKQRQGIRHRLGCTGSLMFVLALVLCIILAFSVTWPLIFLPLSFMIVSITIFIMVSTISAYNEQFEKVALRWKAFAYHLQLLASRQAVSGAEDIASYLSYATAFDLIEKWPSTMEHYGPLALPLWFRELTTAGYIRDQRQAFGEFRRMSQDAHKAGQSSSNNNNTNSRGSGASHMSGSSGAAGGGSISAG